MHRIVIIGGSAAGLAAIKRLRQLKPSLPVLLITAEDATPYSRLQLPEYTAGLLKEEEMAGQAADFFQQSGLEIRPGRRVVHVNPFRRVVRLDSGEEITYEGLLLATGSIPLDLTIPGSNLTGVFKLWSRKDAEAIRAYLPGIKAAVVVGGGLIGLKLAEALSRGGLKVYLVEREGRVLPTLLDDRAAAMVTARLTRAGIEVHLGKEVTAIAGRVAVEGIFLGDDFLPCQMVLLAIGVRPNIDYLTGTGIKINKGIVVDAHMATSVEGIWAAGDVVECYDVVEGGSRVNAVWYNAARQGRVAAENMLGIPVVFHGSMAMNSFQLFDLVGVALGHTMGGDTAHHKGYVETVTLDAGGYKKLVFAAGGRRMIGFLALGDINQAGYAYYRILRDNISFTG